MEEGGKERKKKNLHRKRMLRSLWKRDEFEVVDIFFQAVEVKRERDEVEKEEE